MSPCACSPSLFRSVSFSLCRVVNLSCAPPLCHFLLLRSLLFAWLSSSSLLHPSLSLHPFLPSSSVSFYPYFLPNAITHRCYRAEHNYRSAFYPRDTERGELTIRQFKSTILILTVTPIIIFHITLGRKDKKDYGSSPLPCLSHSFSSHTESDCSHTIILYLAVLYITIPYGIATSNTAHDEDNTRERKSEREGGKERKREKE